MVNKEFLNPTAQAMSNPPQPGQAITLRVYFLGFLTLADIRDTLDH